MFSIDRLFEEVIAFIKRFARTVFWVSLRPRSTLKNLLLQDKDPGVKPSLYFLIALSIYFNFQFVDNSYDNVPFGEFINKYTTNFSESSLTTRILYIFPIGGVIYILVKILSSIFDKNSREKTAYKKFSLYWIGTSSLIFVLSQLSINVSSLLLSSSDGESIIKLSSVHNFIQSVIILGWPIVCFALPFFAIMKEMIGHKLTFIMFLTIPIWSMCSVFVVSYLTEATIEICNLKEAKSINFRSIGGTNVFNLSFDTVKNDRDKIYIKVNGILSNTTDKSYYIHEENFISVTDTTWGSDSIFWRKHYDFSFKIASLNGNKFMGNAILKPNDVVAVTLESTLHKDTFDIFIPPKPYNFYREKKLRLSAAFLSVENGKTVNYSWADNIEIGACGDSLTILLREWANEINKVTHLQ